VLKKLQLDLTKSYEICVATEKIAEMLIAFVQGRSHALTIGCEQGDIPKWDDLIVEMSDRTLEHIQIKRNFTDFDNHACDRNSDPITRRKTNLVELRGLSPLDESIQALASWALANDPRLSNPPRKFTVAVPSMDTLVKKDLQIRHVYDFCRSITQSTTAASLALIAATHAPTANIFLWLTTWCDFQDWSHIIKAFKALDFVHVGTETEIESNTESQLAHCFSNCETVRKQIHTFINDNSTYTSAITPRPLFGQLKPYWLTNISSWTQYIDGGTQWEITGTTDHDFDSVEKAEQIINEFWTSEAAKSIRVHGQSPSDEPMPTALMRLILHLPSPSVAHIQNSAVWQERTKNFMGGTFGTGEEDCQGLAIIECADTYKSADARHLRNLTDKDLEAAKLTDQMNKVNWVAIVNKVNEKISQLPPSDLRRAIEGRWNDWKPKLDIDIQEQVALCKGMLHPEAEGEEILSVLRLGPKTVLLIAKGLILLLSVAVAMSDFDEGWRNVGNGLSITNRALVYWSGPAGKKKKIRLLTEEGISSLIGKEPNKILVLSGVFSTTSEIKESSLAESNTNPYNLASPHQPSLLVTQSMKLSQIIKNGDLSGLKVYLNSELAKSSAAKDDQLNTLSI